MTDDTTKKERDRDGEEDRRKSAGVKVTDKRMFGPDGELREEYRFLKQDGKEEPDRGAEPGRTQERARESGEGTARQPSREAPPAAASSGPSSGAAPVDAPAGAPAAEGPGPFGQPSFLDLVSVLAEPVAIYLGDVRLPDGRNAENLDLARFHIDLLEVLRKKTEGQVTEEEKSALGDLLYRLRMRFVQKRDAQRSGLENRSEIETPG